MKYRIHYETNEYLDYIDIECETIEEIRIKAKIETDKRNLDPDKNNCWSEKLED